MLSWNVIKFRLCVALKTICTHFILEYWIWLLDLDGMCGTQILLYFVTMWLAEINTKCLAHLSSVEAHGDLHQNSLFYSADLQASHDFIGELLSRKCGPTSSAL